MQALKLDTNDRIAALATPWSPSALAVIRLTGEGTVEHLAQLFSRPDALRAAGGHTVVYGHVTDAAGTPLDEVLVTVFRAPRSYTGQESAELSCHGSLPGLRRILGTLTGEGGERGAFRPATPGEFTLRAFVNGKLDLTRAEAVQELVAARTDAAQGLALRRLSGSVEERIRAQVDRLLRLMALLNIQLDYAEDDVDTVPVPLDVVDQVREELLRLSASYRTGRLYQEGVTLVLAGRTNAGKSSLFNLFLKEDRSIVSDEHGTTRDWLESWVSLGGIPVRLVDTAGLREAGNAVEREGIRRSRELIEAADVVLYLVAADGGLDSEDEAFLREHADARLLLVFTKTDLAPAPAAPRPALALSSVTGQGFEQLEAAVRGLLPGAAASGTEGPVIDSLRQKNLLERAVAALDLVRQGAELGAAADLLALDVRDALDALGEITGEVTTADVLDAMFSRFCVGK